MLAAKNRLTKKEDFDFVKQKGQRFQSDCFGILVYRIGNSFSRFGFIVSTKISKKSVERNRVKRLLRESVRQILPDIKTGFDVVFLTRREIYGKSYEEIRNEVKRIFEKAGLLNEGIARSSS